MQEQLNLPELKLKHEMLSRILQIKEAVISTLALLQNELETVLTSHDWKVIEFAVDVLKLFLEITNEISAEKNVTLSKVIPFVKIVRKKIRGHAVLHKENVPKEVINMVQKLGDQIESRFEKIEDNELACQATILDPRFKKYGFYSEYKHKAAYEYLQKRASAIKLKSDTVEVTRENTSEIKQSLGSTIWEEFDLEVNSLTALQNPIAAGIIEVEKYCNEPLLPRTENPLNWWKERSKIYPRLFELVKKRLSLMATSVPCERIFSRAGLTVTQRRSALKPKKVQEIMFLNYNL
ncbi:zinc finger BED domain-containing protein 4-like [Sitophilus oryzae]|uniref:Zinc finger BED domain-containing protein 4-like n=1 Tax=Sitophilus oryzae TaxID=7048 RepID=A0A6J2Y260_SITOR|nr:zinc finger BED domain-containing protein 4-like [Sitophilus oryzae]